mgnify:CR=1 FL=1
MLNEILPPHIDNTYRGHRLALWLFAVILVVKAGIALGTMFNGRAAAQTADGIPLESFGAAGAAAVVSLFAIWGLSQLVLTVIGVLVLVRYRAMISLMFALFLFEHLVRRVIFLVRPIARTGAPPGLYINLTLLAAMIVGLVLSLRRRADLPLPQ